MLGSANERSLLEGAREHSVGRFATTAPALATRTTLPRSSQERDCPLTNVLVFLLADA